jgi:hypothetical protein
MNVHQTTESYEEPRDRLLEGVGALCASAVTVTLLLCAAWLLSQERDTRLVEVQTDVNTSRTVRTEQLPQRVGQQPAGTAPAAAGSAASRSPAGRAQPYVMYLVGSQAEAAQLGAFGLSEHELVFAVETPEDLDRVQAALHDLENSLSSPGTNRSVTIVDRRQQ